MACLLRLVLFVIFWVEKIAREMGFNRAEKSEMSRIYLVRNRIVKEHANMPLTGNVLIV